MLSPREKRTKWHLIRLYEKAGGCRAVGLICGVSEGVARAWRTANALNRIPFDALCALEEATGDYDCTREHAGQGPTPPAPQIDIPLLRQISRDFADMSDTVLRAVEDRFVTPCEANEIAPLADAVRIGAGDLFHAAAQIGAANEAAE
ncbi:MAG: hypothetical protein AAF205_00120 [Pseudomonadota bacterium]